VGAGVALSTPGVDSGMISLPLNHHFTQLIQPNLTSTQSNLIVCAVTRLNLDDTNSADSLSRLINTRANSYCRPHRHLPVGPYIMPALMPTTRLPQS
jgi:hypothetical protein